VSRTGHPKLSLIEADLRPYFSLQNQEERGSNILLVLGFFVDD
jgi:hypothetical protein